MLKVFKCLSYDLKNVRVVRIVSREEEYYFFCSFFFSGFLSSFNGICKVIFMLFSIKAIGNFCHFNVFSLDNRFSFVFSSLAIVQMHLAKQNGKLLRQKSLDVKDLMKKVHLFLN